MSSRGGACRLPDDLELVALLGQLIQVFLVAFELEDDVVHPDATCDHELVEYERHLHGLKGVIVSQKLDFHSRSPFVSR